MPSPGKIMQCKVSNVMELVLLKLKFPDGVVGVNTQRWHLECVTPEGLFNYSPSNEVWFYERMPHAPKADQPDAVIQCSICRGAITAPPREKLAKFAQQVIKRY